jgi:hypothetical protein
MVVMGSNPFRSKPEEEDLKRIISRSEYYHSKDYHGLYLVLQIVTFITTVAFATLLTKAYMHGEKDLYWLVTPATASFIAFLSMRKRAIKYTNRIQTFFFQQKE